MKLTSPQKEIVDAIIDKKVWDIPSYLEHFGKLHQCQYDFNGLRKIFEQSENGRTYRFRKGNDAYYYTDTIDRDGNICNTRRVPNSTTYSVELHMKHPRKSKCNCPHADGKRIICKHIVATYFTILPGEAKKFYEEAMAYQEEEEKRNEDLTDKVCHYVWHMKRAELQEALLQMLFDGPDWQFDRFVRENGLEDGWG